MKNLLLIITILATINIYSQKEKGTITLLNGTVLSGLVKVTNTSFKFKKNENADIIKYDYNDAIAATETNKNNEVTKYEFVAVDYQEKPLLLTIISDGFLKLYGDFTTSYGGGAIGAGMGFRSSSVYHIKRTTDKLGQYFIAYGHIPKISFKKVIETYFSDCPKLQEKVEKGDFKKGDFKEIVNYYNENCAPKK